MGVKVGLKEGKKIESPPPELTEIELDDAPPEFTELEPVIEVKVEEGFKTVSSRVMPPFPAKIIRADKSDLFFGWIDLLELEDWIRLSLYLYREWPWIDRKRDDPNNPTYIDKIGNKTDIEKIKINHGSGEYKIIVNDVNTKKSLGEAHFKINDADHPPKLRLDELVVEHRSNKTYVDRLIAEGKITPEGKVMTGQQQGGFGNDPALVSLLTRLIEKVTSGNDNKGQSKDATLEAVISILTKTSDQAMQGLREQIKSDSPDKMVSMLGILKELMPKQENNNTMLETILKLQADAHARESLMMTKLIDVMTVQKEGGDSFDKELDRFVKLKEIIGESSEKGGGKKSTLETILEYTSPFALKLADLGLNILNMKNYQAGLAKQQTQPPQAQQTPVIEAREAVVQSEGGKVVEMPQPIQDQASAILKGPAGPMILSALQRGQDGASFAEGIENTFGPLVYDQALSLGKEGILRAMKEVPEFVAGLQQIGATDSVIEKFVDEFVGYGQEEGEDKAE